MFQLLQLCVCVCVWSVDTQVWKLHLVHGDGLVLSVTRWDGNHSGRAGWRPAGGGRWRSSLTFVFRWLLKKKRVHKRRITTHLIVSSKICASRSCSMFAWRKTRFSRSSSFFKTTSLFLSSLVVLFRTLDSQWAAISSNGAFWNFSITWRLFSLSCSSRPVVSEPRGQSGLHYVTLNLFYDDNNTELTFSSQRDFQLMSDLSFSLTSRTVRIYLEMSNWSDPGATGELDFSCNGF